MIGLISNGHAAENSVACDDELRRAGSSQIRVYGLVVVAAEDAVAAHGHVPVPRYADVDAAKDGVGLDHDFIFFDSGLAQIQFNSTEDGHHVAPLEVLRVDTPLSAVENSDFVERAGGVRAGSDRSIPTAPPVTPVHGANQQGNPHADQQYRPQKV